MIITVYTCPKCKDSIFSRTTHDFRSCSCGEISIDGGFDYTKVSCVTSFPKSKKITLDVTEKELYDDWNTDRNKYGVYTTPSTRKR